MIEGRRPAATGGVPPSRPRPAGRLGVLTCMDARLRVEKFDGLARREVHVIRNAGGRASPDAIRSLVVLWRVLGVEEFLVVHHTECRMMLVTNDQLRADLANAVNVDASSLDFMVFDNLRTSVEDDLNTIRRSPYLADIIPSSGFVWDIQAERLQPVDIDPRSQFAPRTSAAPGRHGQAAGTRADSQAPIAVPTGGLGPAARAGESPVIPVPTGGLGQAIPADEG